MEKPVETVWLTAFFKFAKKGREYGFERLHLQHIWKTEEDARAHISFCDEAGWYEGVLIEERALGWNHFHTGKRIFMLQDELGNLDEFNEPEWFKNVVNLIG